MTNSVKEAAVKGIGISLLILLGITFLFLLGKKIVQNHPENSPRRFTVITSTGKYEDLREWGFSGRYRSFKDDDHLEYTFGGDFTVIEQAND